MIDPGSVRVALLAEDPLASFVRFALSQIECAFRVADESASRALVDRWHPHLVVVDLDGRSWAPSDADRRRRMSTLGLTRHLDAPGLEALTRVDDFVELPLEPEKVLPRVVIDLRRRGVAFALHEAIVAGPLWIDLRRGELRLEGGALELTERQRALLYLLVANAGRTLTRTAILEQIWGGGRLNRRRSIASNVVDRYISDLRVKLADDWRRPRFIKTTEEGYRFLPQKAGE